MGWSVRPGHLVLIEPGGLDAEACLTGLVETLPDDHTVVVDLDLRHDCTTSRAPSR